MKKKSMWIIALVIIIAIVGLAIYNGSKMLSSSGADKTIAKPNRDKTTKLIIGDNYFITQINDIYYNIDDYDGRPVEIEGFPLTDEDYKFVGRYGPRMLCG